MLKKYISILTVFVFAISLPHVLNAETRVQDTDNIQTQTRPSLKARGDARVLNNEENREEKRIENRVGKIGDDKLSQIMDKDDRKSMMLDEGSSTDKTMFKKDIKVEIKKNMELRIFEIRKNALIKELGVALRSLDSIDARIKTRMEKLVTDGKNVTEIKALLATAEQKLEKARTDVKALESLKPIQVGTSTAATSTAKVDLAKPRVLGDVAIKSVKEARDAFKKVVNAIAHEMGDGRGSQATTTKK